MLPHESYRKLYGDKAASLGFYLATGISQASDNEEQGIFAILRPLRKDALEDAVLKELPKNYLGCEVRFASYSGGETNDCQIQYSDEGRLSEHERDCFQA